MSSKRTIDHQVTLSVTTKKPSEIRRQVVSTFLDEQPGNDSETHRYTYWVESLSDGSRIYLRRPASLHKGMDFAIICERFWKHKNGNDRPPRHKDVDQELQTIAKKSAQRHRAIREALDKVWEGELPDDVVSGGLVLSGDLAAERALKLARWMFIEQDLAYWTGQGRRMLKRAFDHGLKAARVRQPAGGRS